MYSEETIRNHIKKLYETNPCIHVDVTLTRPKVVLRGAEAKIIGVYRHFFQVEETSGGIVKRHSLQYTDIFMGNIRVLELPEQLN